MPLMLTLPLTVELTRNERVLAKHIAKTRFTTDREAEATDVRVRDVDPFGWKIDLEGFGAEMAFAKALNLYPDFTTEPRSGGVDCRLPSGLTVDVKGTVHLNGNLIAPTSKNASGFGADICVLVVGSIPVDDQGQLQFQLPASFTVVGWAWTTDLINQKSIRMVGKTPTYFVERGKLHKTLPLDILPTFDTHPSIHQVFEDPNLVGLFS